MGRSPGTDSVCAAKTGQFALSFTFFISETDRQTDRWKDRRMERWMEKWPEEQTDRMTDTFKDISKFCNSQFSFFFLQLLDGLTRKILKGCGSGSSRSAAFQLVLQWQGSGPVGDDDSYQGRWAKSLRWNQIRLE